MKSTAIISIFYVFTVLGSVWVIGRTIDNNKEEKIFDQMFNNKEDRFFDQMDVSYYLGMGYSYKDIFSSLR